ncbi:mannosyl-glycoprotein endo-beta-N-acetylglucosaminidase [Streptococcus pneumoniae]|nr:mannosyl-glycoprotein endo-beta-N-acetylglucosaminidase [Streptococcus pneumoniae]VOW59487.1 mannosyl-glycoprotein endo-beta-N-acetylglucosaminidase [Streptococcus pneumoniae]VPJ01836.1 mannosyl-glycoprotein endo-beta-N-acetylglucosaminidase [Streptococcus pneumoniae]VQO46487.1 mannosyl-glycoprotein endo-beta-N-acetylglucosaminidase [Streptococcus pneumoniae]VRH36922.1 mannosyl-glycoprotein endo-beta-N-acetylglucosaminidase [Streptococcus pneumoniae]
MKKVRFIFLALLFFLASPEGAMASDGTWQGKQYLKEDGSQAANEWVFDTHYQSWFYIKADANYAENEWLKQGDDYFYLKSGGYLLTSQWINQAYVNASGVKVQQGWLFDKQYQSWFYIKENGNYADKEWIFENGHYYYLKSGGYMAANEWIWDKESWFYLKFDGKMAEKEWVYDSHSQAWYYFKSGGYMTANEWIWDKESWFYLKSDGKIAEKEWVYDSHSQAWYYFKSGGYMTANEWIWDKESWFYLKSDGKIAEKEWVYDSHSQAWYYFKSGGYMTANEWIWDKESWFYLKSDGKMAEKEWVYDSHSQAWYYFKSGGYMAKNETVDGYQLGSDGKWLGGKATNENAAYYQVVPVTANVYDSDGEKLSYISQGSVVWLDKDRKSDDKRLAITISGLSGYMKTEDLQALDASKDFIPYYESDGHRFYHYVAQNASIPVASHLSDMEVGKKYYSADGLHFDGFKLENPFLFKDLTEATNYSAEELDKVFSLLNINNSLLENKGATFKEAEEHYHINALYLLAHSALESNWGRSKIAKDKNNFFGITAYDTTPYLSAKTFDDVDKGILGATKWIKENYIDRGRTFLGNKASGMNVEYASDPYWGEKIASVMMKINEKLGGKD